MFFVVRYYREALTVSGNWCPVMDGGFVSQDCSLDEVKGLVDEIVSWHDGVHSRISKPQIIQITSEQREQYLKGESCFWGRQLEKMTYRATERFRQDNV